MVQSIAKELSEFINNSPSCFHTIETIKTLLKQNSFFEIKEHDYWNLIPGQKYYVTRNDSSLIAFSIAKKYVDEGNLAKSMRIVAVHGDSPSFKIKENPEMTAAGHYIKLNTEKYGGMLCAPWFDRPLSVAGRVIVRDPDCGKLISKLVNIDQDFLIIPNLAIHMNRQANSGMNYNPQKDLLPLYGMESSKDTFMTKIAENASVNQSDILGHDLFIYNRQRASIWGPEDDFISAPRLDDLQCTFASLKGFLESSLDEHLSMLCVFDNEEVGSETKQGAASTFLYDTITRIHENLSLSKEDYHVSLANSFMISADNAHAVHPNYPEQSDPVNQPYINGGIVIKFNANQKYCTDGVSAAMFRDLCQKANVPVQVFTNRSDMAGGSTLGNISNTNVSLNTVDIGLPQLSMHSPYETAGMLDTEYLIRAIKQFF